MGDDHNFKKHLGQNWLIDTTVIKDIVQAAKISSNRMVVEIGPGAGALTKALLEAGSSVIAIEKDRDLIPELESQFARYSSQFQLLQSDIRDIDLADLIINGQPYQLVANIPYYLSGLIMKKFLTASQQPDSMTLLIQREVADRILALDNKQSVLSLSVQVYGQAIKIRNVKAGAFRPIPKVQSAVIHIKNINRNWFAQNQIAEARFFDIIKRAFNQKRKTLGASLGLDAHSSYQKRRPESMSLNDWAALIQGNPQL
jgi:16S rRNA (adenine1518-N6/adenine1519-N6)-dimethyltransferase